MSSAILSKILTTAANLRPDDKLAFDSRRGEIVGPLKYRTIAVSKGGEVACNRETLTVFRKSLSEKYGVFGEHAFDMLLGKNLSEGKPLFVRDVRIAEATLKNPASRNRQKIITARFRDELSRQLETHPLTMGYPEQVRDGLMTAIFNKMLGAGHNKGERDALFNIDSPEMLATWVSCLIESHVSSADFQRANPRPPGAEPENPNAPANRGQNDEIVGLRNLSSSTAPRFEGKDTSVEDRINSGELSSGMRVNSFGEKLVLETLKTKGVEPGFIARRDWSAEQTRELMTPGTYLDGKARAILAKLKPRLFANGNVPDDQTIADLKVQHFVEIRRQVLSGVKNLTGSENSSVVRLRDRFIVKFDYNENDRTSSGRGSSGKFRLPSRVGVDKGRLMRCFRLKSANAASCDAVREALANDLTRAMGISAQELELVRGEYSDGHPKFMLKAKIAEGYKDFEGNFLVDGRIVRSDGGNVEDLGKYKAAYLLLADRDVVGSRGQNKGLIGGRFFAIDPGHSLEGNGETLTVHDDFTFEDTKIMALQKEKRFANFSVFDDSNRSEKLRGWLTIRQRRDTITTLFNQYETTFSDRRDDTEAERELKKEIRKTLSSMRSEFEANYRKLSNVFQEQVSLHTSVSRRFDDPKMGDKVIDAIENFERATSAVRTSSKNNKVKLKHLEVVPKTRQKWTAAFDPKTGAVTFMSASSLPKDRADKLERYLQMCGHPRNPAKKDGRFSVTIPADKLKTFLDQVFTETNVRLLFHPQPA